MYSAQPFFWVAKNEKMVSTIPGQIRYILFNICANSSATSVQAVLYYVLHTMTGWERVLKNRKSMKFLGAYVR